ncbi:MAG TPA: elongation factor G [Armatimonadota bacterium]|nr:elongation factor G [Armatimonadota bacterium]
MKKYAIEAIRNVAVVGHSGAGKTSLIEALLYTTGAIDRLGKVDDGTATTDYDPDEIKRKISINTAVAPCEWSGRKLNLLDTPGYPDFVGDVVGALRVADGSLIVVDAVGGVEVGTETGWDVATSRGVARAFFVNKMERENADFNRVLEQLRTTFGRNVAPVQLPIGSQDSFRGVVDLVDMKAYIWEGGKPVAQDIPADLQGQAQEHREALVEVVAETDDELTMKYLDGEELTTEEIRTGLGVGVIEGKIIPVLCGSGSKQIGLATLLDFIAGVMPSPAAVGQVAGTNPAGTEEETRTPDGPFSALVFKTMADPYVGKLTYFRVYSGNLKSDSTIYNSSKGRDERVGQVYFVKGKHQDATTEVGAGDIGAVAKLAETTTGDTLCDKAKPIVYPPVEFPAPVYSLAIRAKTKADEDKLGPALSKIADEDPTFNTRREAATGQTLISGMGDTHLDIVTDRLKRKFGVEVETEMPKVPYQETITTTSEAQGRHKKQTGGRGQFGDAWVRLEPLPRGGGYEFVDQIVGGAIPRQWIPSVDKGIQEAMSRGILAGYPVIDVRATVYDGSYHNVDSSDMAFQLAGILAFQNAAQKANPVILEPVVEAEIIVPEEYMGDVISDMNTKRGRIQGMEPIGGGKQRIKATVPQSEMMRYAIDLRSIARGRGTFKAEFSHYEEVPAHITQQIVEQAKKAKEE